MIYSKLVIKISKKVLYHNKNLKKRKSSLNWLVHIEIILAKPYYVIQKVKKLTEIIAFLIRIWGNISFDFFKICWSNSRQKCSNRLHKMFSVLWERGLSALESKKLTHFIFKLWYCLKLFIFLLIFLANRSFCLLCYYWKAF